MNIFFLPSVYPVVSFICLFINRYKKMKCLLYVKTFCKVSEGTCHRVGEKTPHSAWHINGGGFNGILLAPAVL